MSQCFSGLRWLVSLDSQEINSAVLEGEFVLLWTRVRLRSTREIRCYYLFANFAQLCDLPV